MVRNIFPATRQARITAPADRCRTGRHVTFRGSRESENKLKLKLKAKASVEIEAVKAGAGTEQAKKEAASSDRQYALERTTLQFRGGDGSPSGIDSSWIMSLHARPAIVKAKMERLSHLLTERFFPDGPTGCAARRVAARFGTKAFARNSERVFRIRRIAGASANQCNIETSSYRSEGAMASLHAGQHKEPPFAGGEAS